MAQLIVNFKKELGKKSQIFEQVLSMKMGIFPPITGQEPVIRVIHYPSNDSKGRKHTIFLYINQIDTFHLDNLSREK